MIKRLLMIELFWGLFIIYPASGYAEDFAHISRRWGTPIFVSSFTRIGVDNYAAGGAALAQNSTTTAAFTNPAGFSVNKLSFYAELGKWSESDWHEDVNRNGHFVIPGYIAVGLPINKISVSLGYMNYYHNRYIYRTEVRTITEPGGTGEYIELENNIRLHTFFGSASYSQGEKFSLGFTAGLNYFVSNYGSWYENAKGDGFGFIFIAGLLIKPFQKFSFAYNLKYLPTINYDLSVNLKEPVIIDSTMSGNYEDSKYLAVSESYPYAVKFPFIFETGMMYQPFPFLSIYSKIEFQKWQGNNDRDCLNYHLGANFLLLKWLTFSGGYFSQDESFIYYDIDQKFLTSGLRIQINESFSLSANIMDSHILKEKDIANSYYPIFF